MGKNRSIFTDDHLGLALRQAVFPVGPVAVLNSRGGDAGGQRERRDDRRELHLEAS